MRNNIIVTLMLMAILGLFCYFSPDVFLSKDIYLSFLPNISIVLFLSLALLPLIIVGEFDMSFPSLMAMSGFILAYVFEKTHNFTLGIISCICFGILAGGINAILVAFLKLPSIIATIGTQFFYRGLATILSGGLSISLFDLSEDSKEIFVGRIYEIPVQIFWALAFSYITYILIFRHPFGDGILFFGDNKKAAKMLGFNEKKVKSILFIYSGLMSALASIFLSLEFISWTPTQGDGYMLLVFAAIFIGGTSAYGGQGSVYGTIIGCIIINILESGIVSMGLDTFYTRAIQGLIIIFSVALYSFLNKKS